MFFLDKITFFNETQTYLLKEKVFFNKTEKEDDFFGVMTENNEDCFFEFRKKNIPLEILKSMIEENNQLLLKFEDLEEIQYSYNLDYNLVNESNDLLKTIINKFNYKSDDGFLIINEEKKWCYYYGEDLYNSIKTPNTFEPYNLFIIGKDFESTFLNEVNKIEKFKIKLSSDNNVVTKKKSGVKEFIFL
ncbi:hypothetical protein [Tenacibaculum maritimum]|uniref:hypothetical protein n=1 Tax=Tenacibaculum maritimum TaxID=107401 RepID=UPI00389006CB